MRVCRSPLLPHACYKSFTPTTLQRQHILIFTLQKFFGFLFVFVTEIRLKDASNRKRWAVAAAVVAAALGGCVYR